MRRAIAAAAATLILGVPLACSSGSSDTGGTTSEATTTTTRQVIHGSLTGPSTGRELTATDPLRVLLLGDSILYDAQPAIVANLTSTGVVRTTDHTTPGFNFGHGLGFNANDDFQWRQVIAEALEAGNPEVVVAWFGIIDSSGMSKGLQTPEAFRASVREAFTLLTADDRKVIMFGVLPSVEYAGRPDVRPMGRGANDVLKEVAAEFPGKVEYYDTDMLLSPTSSAVYDHDGMRVRKLDLIHICPDGAMLIADAVHFSLAGSWPVPPAAPGWTAGQWRTSSRYDDPPGACVNTHPGLGT